MVPAAGGISGSETHLKPLRGGGRHSPDPKPLCVDFGRKSLETPLRETGTTCKVHMTKAVFPGGGVGPPSPFAPLLTAPSSELNLSSKCARFGNSYTRFKTLSPPQLMILHKLKFFLSNYAAWTPTGHAALLFNTLVFLSVASVQED